MKSFTPSTKHQQASGRKPLSTCLTILAPVVTWSLWETGQDSQICQYSYGREGMSVGRRPDLCVCKKRDSSLSYRGAEGCACWFQRSASPHPRILPRTMQWPFCHTEMQTNGSNVSLTSNSNRVKIIFILEKVINCY